MLNKRKLTIMLEVFLLLLFPLSLNLFLVEASTRSGKAKASEQSSNQIAINEEEKPKSEDGQFYYLPSQTIFGVTETLAGTGDLTSTSPPHLMINPAPIQTMYEENTILNKDSSMNNKYYNSLHQSQCVSETPVAELESRFLLPSRDSIKESVIMSGHLEIASKTSSIEKESEIGNIVSKPSIALQGTVLHTHTISDL